MPGATPTYGFRYQTLGDPPHGPNLGKDLAEDVEAALAAAEATAAAATAAVQADLDSTEAALDARLDTLEAGVQPMAFGSVNVSVASGGGFQSVAVVFPVGRFSVAPHVNLTAGSGRLNCAAVNITAAGFDVNVNNWTSGSSGSVPVYWHAVKKV